jgi:hypothetical protein
LQYFFALRLTPVRSKRGGTAVTNESSKDPEANQLNEPWQGDLLEEESFSPRRRARERKGLTGWQGVAIGLGIGIAVTAAVGTQLPKLTSTGKTEKKTQQVAAPSQTVTVAAVQTTRIPRTLSSTGTIAARNLIPVLPQANGLQVKQILVGEGQPVKAEQVMAVLDDSVLRAQIDAAKAEVESQQATVRQRQASLQQTRATLARLNVHSSVTKLLLERAQLPVKSWTLVPQRLLLPEKLLQVPKRILRQPKPMSVAVLLVVNNCKLSWVKHWFGLLPAELWRRKPLSWAMSATGHKNSSRSLATVSWNFKRKFPPPNCRKCGLVPPRKLPPIRIAASA